MSFMAPIVALMDVVGSAGAIADLFKFWRLSLCVVCFVILALCVETGWSVWVLIAPGFVLGAAWELLRRNAAKENIKEQP